MALGRNIIHSLAAHYNLKRPLSVYTPGRDFFRAHDPLSRQGPVTFGTANRRPPPAPFVNDDLNLSSGHRSMSIFDWFCFGNIPPRVRNTDVLLNLENLLFTEMLGETKEVCLEFHSFGINLGY